MNYNNGNYGMGFNPTFTIPRRNENLQAQRTPSYSNSVLSDPYGNIPNTYPKSSPSMFMRRPDVSTSVPPRNIGTDGSSQINQGTPISYNSTQQSWLNKNTCWRSVSDLYGDMYDSTLPKELLMMYQPLFCKLCMIQLTSNSMAKLHYHSKNHDKKLRAWLRDYSERTGEPLHDRANAKRVKKEEDNDPKYFHCDVCDLQLTGKMHAESHYMGKNHQRALMGKKDPAGKGFFNEQGKWTRTVAAKNDKSGRDGFGQDFAKKEREEVAKKARDNSRNTPFKCWLCDISLSSESQLEAHLQGSKHKKKEKHRGLAVTLAQRLAGNEDYVVNTDGGDSNISAVASDDPMAIYRTPSGYFYCKICDLSLNSNMQFMAHLNSKKHKHKSTAQASQSTESMLETATPQSSDDILSHL